MYALFYRNLSNCVAETDPGSAGRGCDPAVERGVDRREADGLGRFGAQTVLPVTGDSPNNNSGRSNNNNDNDDENNNIEDANDCVHHLNEDA